MYNFGVDDLLHYQLTISCHSFRYVLVSGHLEPTTGNYSRAYCAYEGVTEH